jgi:hypothetical protein
LDPVKKFLLFLLLLSPAVAHGARLFVAASSDKISNASTLWTNNFSASAWFVLASQPGSGSGFTVTSNTNGAGFVMFNLIYENNGVNYDLVFQWTTAAATYVVYKHNLAALTTGQWYNLVWTVDLSTNPDTLHCYLDGVDKSIIQTAGSSNSAGPCVSCGGTGRIGSRWWGTEILFFDGKIDQVGLWLGTLNAAQALALARGAKLERVSAVDLDAAWRLDGRSPELDSSNNHRVSLGITGTTVVPGPPVLR